MVVGHASVWMTHLQLTYAPDINVVGAAHGGALVDLKLMEHGPNTT